MLYIKIWFKIELLSFKTMAKKDIWDGWEQEWIFNELYDDNFSQEDAGPHDQEDGTEAGENWPEHCCQEFFCQTPLLFRFVDQVSIFDYP